MSYFGQLELSDGEKQELEDSPELLHLYNARRIWEDLKTGQQLHEALKAIFDDNCFYHKSGDGRAFRLSMEAIKKAEGK